MSNTTAPTPNDDHFGNREEMIARYKEAIAHWQADKEALDYQMAALKVQLAEFEKDESTFAKVDDYAIKPKLKHMTPDQLRELIARAQEVLGGASPKWTFTDGDLPPSKYGFTVNKK